MPTEPTAVGQRCASEREPELGLGTVVQIDAGAKRIVAEFAAAGERRIYALGTPVLRRVAFRVGEIVATRSGTPVTIDAIEADGPLLTYVGANRRVPEADVSDVVAVGSPAERLLSGQADANEDFDLRVRALHTRTRLRQSAVRGFLGGRVELIPHQFYILHEVAGRHAPRVLLADEVGLGKTIEACLIVQRLLATGQAGRVLIVVPEPLTHQWFVELLRRFNLWFAIYDENRCGAIEEGDPDANPFLAAQLVLCALPFVTRDPVRHEQAVAAGWDLVVVDEAHHLAWSPGTPSPEYAGIEALALRSRGVLLLTGTPTQLGQEGHFARLRLLDPDRYPSYERFVAESEGYAAVAAAADRLLEGAPLTDADRSVLARIFARDTATLATHLQAVATNQRGARDALVRTLLDRHGIGRVMFRNRRERMTGFPERRYCPVSLPVEPGAALIARNTRELAAEEAGQESELRYSYRDDPRIDWLANFLREQREAKVLLICRHLRKAAAIEAALQAKMKARSALFHEGLPLVQRDRNAAWFAERDGAQLLICSEIGSEGRNFQFAHHLVLFDLPLNPGLLEQRIGRLDRIGQTEAVRIHVPFLEGSAEEVAADWYHRGLDAFEHPVHGAAEFESAFRSRLLELATARDADATARDALIAETASFRHALEQRLRHGRDRLLELNSFNPAIADRVLGQVRAAEADIPLRQFLFAVLDHFGVRIREHEDGDVFLDPSHAYVEAFPSLPADGILATFDRRRALAREDITYVTADHPLVRDALDLLLDSPAGTVAFGTATAERPDLLVEAVYVLEPIADARSQADRFLAPTPIRVVVDWRGRDRTAERDERVWAGFVADAELQPFLERPEFSPEMIRQRVADADAVAGRAAERIRRDAATAADRLLSAEVNRLADLQQLNDHVRAEEVTLARTQREAALAAIASARIRLDALRIILETPER